MTGRIQEFPHDGGDDAARGRLRARVRPPSGPSSPAGLHRLELGSGRDGLVYAPAGVESGRPLPLLVALHGANGTAEHIVGLLRQAAEVHGVILLAPESRRRTWDSILGRYGEDVRFLDAAIPQTFDRYAVDPAGVAVGGFSDGASYALSLGIANGDLFGHVLAYSPGFAAPRVQNGRPRFFVSHGVHDDVLPIARCSRRLAPMLERGGYDVRYVEFDGGHTVPDEVIGASMRWLLGREP